MKHILFLCDGTWRRSDSPDPTNVVRLAQALLPEDAKGAAQVPIYIQGTGSGRGATKAIQYFDIVVGGFLGAGLMQNVVEAYRHLVFLYEPGDRVHIFGYSRGAFTARTLAGLIRSTGIVGRDRLTLIPEAVARYQIKGRTTHHPGSEASHRHRLKMSPDVATSEKEVAWRVDQGLRPPHLLRIAYLGVWDTVGALGVPASWLIAPLVNRRYAFHDTDLTSLVASARHAIALDERRKAYAPTTWGNIDALNAEAGQDPPAYQERYFAGDHGSVGGGGDILGLSSIALRWVIEGAEIAGLSFDAAALARIEAEADPLAPLRSRTAPPGVFDRFCRMEDRRGPSDIGQLHSSARERWGTASAGYRPGSLKRIETDLAAYFEKQGNRVV